MSKLIDDKRFIPILFKDHHHLVPELSVGVEDNRIIYLIMDGVISIKKPKLEELSSFLGNRYDYLFVKPAGLSRGKGAFKVKVEDFPSVLHLFEFGALDIAVTNSGLRLLEVNSLPGRYLMQFNKPAFFNLEFKEFCYSKGYGEYTPKNEPQSTQSTQSFAEQ